jgi:hypothetical protein
MESLFKRQKEATPNSLLGKRGGGEGAEARPGGQHCLWQCLEAPVFSIIAKAFLPPLPGPGQLVYLQYLLIPKNSDSVELGQQAHQGHSIEGALDLVTLGVQVVRRYSTMGVMIKNFREAVNWTPESGFTSLCAVPTLILSPLSATSYMGSKVEDPGRAPRREGYGCSSHCNNQQQPKPKNFVSSYVVAGAWWCMHVIPASQEAEEAGLRV